MEGKLEKNLVLTGMMGVGKSTVGRNLAEKLSYDFVDIDEVIEAREKASINNIFKIKGESYFRKIETKITLEKLNKSKVVISLGGGAFLNKFIRNRVKSSCISFWLDISLNKLISRLNKSKKRPLLMKNLNQTINKIYLKRKKTYNEADYKIVCGSLKTYEIVNKISKIYENTRN